jgi:hypothetical protein
VPFFCIFATQDPHYPDDDEPRFLECVKLNFDEAAKYSKMNDGLLQVPEISIPPALHCFK